MADPTDTTPGLNPKFMDLLSKDQKLAVLSDMAKTGNTGGTFAMNGAAPESVYGGALSQAPDAAPEPSKATAALPEGQVGALSQAAAAPQAAAPMAGALSAAMADYHVPTIQEALAQYAPQDGSRNMYLALAKGFGSATKTGNFGEQVGNAADSVLQMKTEQERLRMQYLPQIMTQMASQQQMRLAIAGHQDMITQMNGGAQPAAPAQPGVAPAPAGGPAGAPGAPVGGPAGGPIGAQGAPTTTGAPAQPQQGPQGLMYPITQMEKAGILSLPFDQQQKAWSDMIIKHSEPSGPAMLAIQAGYKPGTPEFADYMQKAAAKGIYIAPVAGRAGGYLIFADGHKEFNPSVPEGMVGNEDPVTHKMVFTQDHAILAGMTAAKSAAKRGENAQTLASRDQSVVNANGTYQPMSVDSVLHGGAPAGAPAAPAVPGAPAPATPAQGIGSPYDASTVATNRANAMEDSWKGTVAANRSAQGVVSNLDNIIKYAPGAITGQGADQLGFLNGLLAAAGFEKAKTAQEATQLLKKNAAQVVSKTRMGMTGGGSDAFQASLESGNPNYTMIASAIKEASEQAKATVQMNQSKASFLTPHYLSGHSETYIPAEVNFDKNADPRIWQMANMKPEEAAKFIGTFPPEVALQIQAQRAELKKMGAIK